jgi:hypothetical protein
MKDDLSKEILEAYSRALDDAQKQLEKKYGFKIESWNIQYVMVWVS